MTFSSVSRPALALALLSAVPVHAQDAGESEDIVVTAQANNATEIVNGGSAGVLGDKAAEDIAFSIRSIDESLILNQQPQTLGEVLDNDPTVRTTYGFGNAAEQFVIRGFSLAGDDVGLNGLYGIAPRQLVAPELFGSVQILNGASAFLNGAAPGGSGLGGSVNLLLKRAETRDVTRATLGYASDAHIGGSVDLSRRLGSADQWGVRVNAAYRDGEVAIDREDRRTLVVGGAIDWRSGALSIAADLAYQEVRVDSLRPKVTIGTTAIPDVPRADANYAQDFTYTELRDIFGTLSVDYQLADNALLYARAGFRDGSEDGIYGGITVLNATTGAANGNALFVPRTDNNEALEAGLRVRLGSAITHEFNFGGTLSWQVNRNAFDFLYGPGFAGFDTNIYTNTQVALPASALVGGDLADPFPISRSRLASVFASDTIGLWNDRILITAGLRLQALKVLSYNYYNGGQLDSSYDESAVTPVFGIVVKPVEGLSLYANRIEALQQGPTAPNDPILTNRGEVFAPFRTVQYEIGGKAEIGPVFATLALYRTELPSAFSVLVDPAQPAGQQTFGFNGEQRNQGAELTVSGELTPGLRLIAGAAINDAQFIETATGANEGNDVPGVPEWTANANVEWDLPFVPGFTLTGRVVHTGAQQVNAANTLAIPDWTRFDVGARYVVAAGDVPVTLRLTVDNVANRRYWASAFDVFSAALLQGQPRAVRASISADF